MDSIFNQLLINLQTKLTTDIPDSEATPGIRWVDQDMGQLENYELRPDVPFPCVLVDFTESSYKDQQNKGTTKVQWCELNVQLRLCFDPYSPSNNLAPQATREKALAYYEIEHKIFKALQDWNGGGLLMLPMTRASAGTEKRTDFRVRVISFKAKYEDQATP